MVKKIQLLTFFLLVLNLANAQTLVGINFDINGMSFNGYYDQINYSPQKRITKKHETNSYEKGHYYDLSGKKNQGFIKFENNKIYFKTDMSDTRIKVSEAAQFVIGVDSFFVADKFQINKRIKKKPVFLQFISEFNGHTFAKKYHNQTTVFMVKSNNDEAWIPFEGNQKFKEKAHSFFGHISYLKEKINEGVYTSSHLISMIKMADYQNRYNLKKPIYYDKYWQEVHLKNQACYTAKITNQVDSIWTMEYSKGKEKIYEARYSSFYPHIKNGDLKVFFPNGKVRSIVNYKNDEPTSTEVFNEFGVLQFSFDSEKNKDNNSEEEKIDIVYKTMFDKNNQNLISPKNSSKITKKDPLTGQDYHFNFDGQKLASVYRMNDDERIYQITNTKYSFDIAKLQRSFDRFMINQGYDKALYENAQGTVLLHIMIEPEGTVVEYRLLNQLHPQLDRLVERFAKERLAEGAYRRFRFKPIKINKEKKHFEFVVPFEFSINRTYRKPVNYNHFQNFHHMHLQQFRMQQHQHFMNQQMRSYQPPRFY